MSTENKVIYSMVGVSKFYNKKPIVKICFCDIIPLLLLFLLVPVGQGAASKNIKRPIGTDEFLRLFKANQTILNRQVPPEAILCALRWAQAVARGNEKVSKPESTDKCLVVHSNEKLPEDGLQMEGCVVDDSFALRRSIMTRGVMK